MDLTSTKPLQLFQRVSEFDVQVDSIGQFGEQQLAIWEIPTLRNDVNQASCEVVFYVGEGEIAAARYNRACPLNPELRISGHTDESLKPVDTIPKFDLSTNDIS